MSMLFYMTIFLSTFSIVQTFVLLKRGKINTSYKYLLYSLLFILLDLPILSELFEVYLVSVLLLKIIIASDTDEISDTFIYVSNLTIIALVALKLYPIYYDQFYVCTILSIGLTLILLRAIFDQLILSPLYIIPVILLSSITGSQISTVSLYIYALIFFALYRYNKNRISIAFVCLMLLAFFDSNVVQNIVSDLGGSIDLRVVIASLFILGVSRFMEDYKKRISVTFDHKAIIAIILGAGAIFTPTIMNASFKITRPLPLVLGVVFVILDFKYLTIFKRIKIYRIWDFVICFIADCIKAAHSSLGFIRTSLRYFISTKTDDMSERTKASLIALRGFLLDKTELVNEYLSSTLSTLVKKVETSVDRTGYKEAVAIISAVIISLIILFGVLL